MQVYAPTYSFTRPADTTAYASGDLVANSTTAGSVVPLSFALGSQIAPCPYTVKRIRLSKTNTTATNAQFRVHLYEASPGVTNGDNGAWLSSKAANYLGSADVTMVAFSDGCAGVAPFTAGGEVNSRLPSGATIYALIEARAAYTPGNAEIFTAALELQEWAR